MNDPAVKVRQRTTAGRPARIVNQQISVVTAVGRIVSEIDRGRTIMAEEGLIPGDLAAGLVHTSLEAGEFGCKWLPPPGQIGEYVTAFEQMAARGHLDFLGIIWRLRRTDGGASFWVLPFRGGNAAKQQLQAVMHFITQPRH